MSPEAFDGKWTARGDIWAFGVVLNECLSRKKPFQEMKLAQTFQVCKDSMPIKSYSAASINHAKVLPVAEQRCTRAIALKAAADVELPLLQVVYRVAIQCMHPEVAKDAPEPLQRLLLDCFKPEAQDRPDVKEVIARLDSILLDQEEQTRLAAMAASGDSVVESKQVTVGRPSSYPRVTSSILQGQLPKVSVADSSAFSGP